MSLIRPIQPSFAGGEVSPELYSRVDISKYATCLRKCRNMVIHASGGASNRTGTRFVAQAKYTDKKVIVQEFVFNSEQKYVFEFGDHYIRFYTEGARLSIDPTDYDEWSSLAAYSVNDYVTYGGNTPYLAIQDSISQNPATATTYWTQQSIYEIYSPYGEDDLALLRFESSADVVFITTPDFQTRTLTRYGETDFRLELYAPEDGPFMLENIDETITLSTSATTGSVTLSASTSLFFSGHIGSLWKLRHYIEGQSASAAFSSVTAGSSIKCFSTWRLISHGTWTGKFNVEKSTDGGSTWTVLRTFSSADDYNANTYGTEDIEENTEPFLVRINMTARSSGTANIDLTTDPFYQEGILEVTSYSSATSVTATVLQTVGLTTGTTSWNEGSWSDYRGWPRVSRFYQDRLVFAGSDSEPMTMWMTVTGNYYSFMRHSTLLDTDGITTNLQSRQLNAINGLVAFKRLLVFTSASIWSVGPVSGSAMKPTGFTIEVEEYNGSNGINPIVIGNEAIYAQEHSKIISNIGYELADDSFMGKIANITATHLFKDYEIIDMAYQRNPDHIIWCLRDDGNMVALTYLREQEVVAWHQHDTGGHDAVSGGSNEKGYIKSICVIPSEGFDELWLAVERENGVMIERMAERLITTECNDSSRQTRIEDQFHVDCGVSYGATLVHITSVSMGPPIVITAPNHGFTDGQVVKIDHTDSSLGLNGNTYTVGSATTDTFTITPV